MVLISHTKSNGVHQTAHACENEVKVPLVEWNDIHLRGLDKLIFELLSERQWHTISLLGLFMELL